MLVRSGALGMNCHPERASATEGSPARIGGDPSPRVTRFRMTWNRRHMFQVHWKGALARIIHAGVHKRGLAPSQVGSVNRVMGFNSVPVPLCERRIVLGRR